MDESANVEFGGMPPIAAAENHPGNLGNIEQDIEPEEVYNGTRITTASV
jgi:hypothetical protein